MGAVCLGSMAEVAVMTTSNPHAKKVLEAHDVDLEDMVYPNGIADGLEVHRAVKTGSKEVVELVIDFLRRKRSRQGRGGLRSSYFERQDRDGFTPLQLACLHGYTDVIPLLHEAGANVEARDCMRGRTPLHRAVIWDQVEVVELLLKLGANPNAEDHDYRTPLALAVATESLDILNLLLPATESSPIDLADLLHEAVSSGTGAACSPLIKAGADVNFEDEEGDCPIHCAAANGTAEAVRLLMEAGVKDINAPNADEQTPLHVACTSANIDTALELLRLGADALVQSGSHGLTALHMCALEGLPEVAEAIISICPEAVLAKADKGNRHKMAIHIAAEWDAWEVAEVLLKHSEPDLTDANGNTALLVAAEWGSTDTTRLLLEAGASTSHTSNVSLLTPLHRAAKRGKLGCCKHLLEYGASKSARDSKGQTPLDLAVAAGHDEVVSLLSC